MSKMFRYLVVVDSHNCWNEIADDIYLNTTTIDNFHMAKWKPILKDCTTCKHFDIESCYGVCDKHGVLNDVVKNCKDYEEQTNENGR